MFGTLLSIFKSAEVAEEKVEVEQPPLTNDLELNIMPSVNLMEVCDAEFAIRLRQINLNYFTGLARIHLARVLGIDTANFELPFIDIEYDGKVWKCVNHRGWTEPTIDSGFLYHLPEIMDFITNDKNVRTEGIFEKPGNESARFQLQKYMRIRRIPIGLGDARPCSVHDCTAVVKAFLNEMPQPLFPVFHYTVHVAIAKLHQRVIENPQNAGTPEFLEWMQNLLTGVELLVQLLPDENRNLLQDLIGMLHKIAVNQKENGMSAEKLADVFAPILVCPRNMPPEALELMSRQMAYMLQFMIQRGPVIFKLPVELANDIRDFFHQHPQSVPKKLATKFEGTKVNHRYCSCVDRELSGPAQLTKPGNEKLQELRELIPKSVQEELRAYLKAHRRSIRNARNAP